MATATFTRQYIESIRQLERRIQRLEDIVLCSKEALDKAQREMRQIRHKLIATSKTFVQEADIKIKNLQGNVEILRHLNDDKDNDLFLSIDLEKQPDNDNTGPNHTGYPQEARETTDSRCGN